jgi:hypothetical protein
MAFVNNTTFSYRVDASGLRHIEFLEFDEKVDHMEIEPGTAKEAVLLFENRREKETENGELIDFGKMIVQKSGEFGRHMTDIMNVKCSLS